MTYQEKDHPRAGDGKWEPKQLSEPEGVSLAPAAKVLPKPIMASVTLQQWSEEDPDQAEEVGFVEFDAAPVLAGIVPGLSPYQLSDLDPSICDQVYEEAVARGLVPNHDGPFELSVQEALDEALESDPTRFDTPYPHELVARHKDTVLMAPLSAYELGARVDEDNFVEALAIVDQDDMIGVDTETYYDTISEKITGSQLLMDPQATAVSVTPEGRVVYRISGDASAVIDSMTDDETELFEAGRAAAEAKASEAAADGQ